MNVRERIADADALSASVQTWLASIRARRCRRATNAALHGLFHAESHWRDILALTWSIETVSGADAIARRSLPRLPSHPDFASIAHARRRA